MNKALKLKDEENPASQTPCGGNRLLISCLGLLSGSSDSKLRRKILGKNHWENSTVRHFLQFTAKEE